MPLLRHETHDDKTEIGVWKIAEDEAWFRDKINIFPEEEERLAQFLRQEKKVEWLASRMLLHTMSGRPVRGKCLKDDHGIPYLEHSRYHISISHSAGMAAVIASPLKVGVDIQLIVDKIVRISHKFLRPDESAYISRNSGLEIYHKYWGAKEALFKAYGKGGIDFIEHLIVGPLDKEVVTGEVRKGDFMGFYDIHFDRIEDHVLVWAKEKQHKFPH